MDLLGMCIIRINFLQQQTYKIMFGNEIHFFNQKQFHQKNIKKIQTIHSLVI